METEQTFTVVIIADPGLADEVKLAVTLKADGLGDALAKAKLVLVKKGYHHFEEVSVEIARDDE
ncbi:hypothetical protein LH850_003044 [Salmonella enterica]|nr:hypothetical protein [Salmonella enterica]EAY4479000.1 hypothetical protein [Salmonella enterica]ECQ3888156.1 hypothetical protein [Salmonella enterica]EEF4843770.1 hypothetical protein [Salmonella enterica]EEG1893194.1 hypothetical protein [Salmonella enterica]EFS3173158.1 hypothetical protein [Salmonella enterica]